MLNYFDDYQKFFGLDETKKYSNGIKESQVNKTQDHIKDTLLSLFRIKNESLAFIGSAGKKKDRKAFNQNLNVVINVTELKERNKLDSDGVFNFIKEQLKREGLDCYEKNNKIIIEYPINGNKKNENIDLICQLSENIEWVKFSRYSPNQRVNESKYTGKYRESVFNAICKVVKKDVKSYFNTNEMVKEFEVYHFDVDEGLCIMTKSFEAKNGVLKRAIILEDSKQIYSDTPDEVVKILFGESFTTEDVKTFEKCLETIKSRKFAYPKKRKEIMTKLKHEIVNFNLVMPEGLM